MKETRIFKVTDGDKLGICFAYYDHFEIEWEDGTSLSTIELSWYGIRKV